MQLVAKSFSQLTTDELFEIYRVRVAVFVVEQNCAYQEVDLTDKLSYHLWLESENAIKAYLRVIPAGVVRKEVSLGRVIAVERHQGLGTEIVKHGIAFAKEQLGAEEIVIEAQTYVRSLSRVRRIFRRWNPSCSYETCSSKTLKRYRQIAFNLIKFTP